MKKIILSICLTIVFLSQAVTISLAALEPDTADALKFAKPPTIDGTISADEWGEASKKDISNEAPANAIAKAGGAEIKFDLWLRWDADNVYLALQTPDEKLINSKSTALMWNGDAIQIEIDPLGNWQSQGKEDLTYISENAREMVYAHNTVNHENQAWCFTLSEVPEGEYAVANRDGKTMYELSIPWSYFDTEAPGAGDTIGVTVAVLSCSNIDYDGWLEWGSGCIVEKSEESKSGNNKITLSDTEVTPANVYPTFAPTPSPTPEPSAKPKDGNADKTLVIIGVIVPVIVIIALVVIILKVRKKKI